VLNPLHSQRGVTLVELLIGLVIVGILLMFGVPAFSQWIQNTRIRTTGEAILNGLQLARAEAVHRNSTVRFQLVDSLDNSCALSTASSNWVVSQNNATGDPSGNCGSAPSDTTAPFIIQTRAAAEGSTSVAVAASQSPIAFNGLGREVQATNADGSTTPNPLAAVTISVSNPTGGACAPAGPMRCLQITVSTAGQVRMCDPALASTDPQGC
jgi:type IV fimbrial biogenesis protein FimT